MNAQATPINRLEDRIRDHLAQHLELFGDGLSLVKKEHVLTNPIGAGGKIDILARDRFGVFVVIEIKRSDQSARQALNEIHKYTALLRIQHGLDETQVRVMIISTNWAELRVPLSECVASFPFTIDPFEITVQPDGTVTQVAKVTLLPKSGIIRLSRVQGAFGFQSTEERDAALPVILKATQDAIISDYVVLKIDYGGLNEAVCYPYFLYFLFSSPLLSATLSESTKIKEQLGWEEELDQPDENFLTALTKALSNRLYEFEIGYPEKLTTILAHWKLVEVLRFGRLARDHSLLTDEDIMSMAQAADGGSSVYLFKTGSPRFSAGWKQLKSDATNTATGMPGWERILPALLNEVETNTPNAAVSVHLYNPCNLLMSLYLIACNNNYSLCPRLEIIIEDPASKRVRLISSLLVWKGRPVKHTPHQLVRRICGHIEYWLGSLHFHETHTYEAKMLSAHGIVAPVLEFCANTPSDCTVLALRNSASGLVRESYEATSFKGLDDFAIINRNYLKKLKHFLESNIGGLSRSDLAVDPRLG